ncbi:hypothetical protein HPB49_025985 [Dermacentor silvarum]|uniref:Uncharacterized protein n=1 Tax=Dermacentor silvarum TaxID=543639 RepID=A0ACB8D935_DERSI|nr:hypothetical protein HPB49_000822 [Dermacentor silvarum]KAH7986382.1 hypothetical protein HPB49_025985 [Dermacentor silvarum]
MQASFLLSVVGFTNVVGRVAIGAVSDRLGAYRIWLFIGCVMVCGLSTVLSVLSRTYAELQVYAATYGAAGGGFITLSSVVVVDMVGLDRLTNAYGLCLLCLGVAALVGPPLNGQPLPECFQAPLGDSGKPTGEQRPRRTSVSGGHTALYWF